MTTARRPKKPSIYLYPLKGKVKHRKIATFDIESKDGKSLTRPGMTRPFLTCVYDGYKAHLFRDRVRFRDKDQKAKNAWRWEHLKYGGCVDKLCRWMFSPLYNEYTFYAHNGGAFDHLFILPWLAAHRKNGFDFTVIPVMSTIQVVQVSRRLAGKTYKWTILDSMRLLPMSLADACKAMGLPGKKELDLATDEDDKRWEEYNARDCMALHEVMQRVTKLMTDLGGEVGITAPASSMKLFRRVFQKERITRNTHFEDCPAQGDDEFCDGCCHEWIRRSYVGGRTEIFEMMGGFCRLCCADLRLEGQDPDCPRCKGSGVDPVDYLRYYDLNSSYVSALCEPMPVGERIVHEGKLDWTMRERGFIGFCECQVTIPEECKIPPLPKKDKKTGKLVFPRGKFEGIWNLEELALLDHPLVQGKITWVGRTVWFKGDAVFREMMLTLYAYRDKKRPDYDEGMSQLAKLLGNGLYGKFAMALEREEIVFRKDGARDACVVCGKKIDLEPRRLREGAEPRSLCEACDGSKPAGDPDSDVWYRAKKVKPAYVIPQISAHVTSLGRVKLWKYMAVALERGGRLYMVDTDSLLTNVDMPCSTELGDLKDEYPGERLRIVAVQPKVYLLEKEKPFKGEHLPTCDAKKRCKDKGCKKTECALCHGCSRSKVTFKGVPKNKRNKETLLMMLGGGEATYERLEKIRGIAGREFRGPPKMIEVKRRIVSRYEKRVLHPDGTTSPLTFPLTIEPAEQRMLEMVLADEVEILDESAPPKTEEN